MTVDGVLNYTQWYTDDRNPGNLYGNEGDLDPLCIERINILCEKTGAKVVVTSDWRIVSGWQERLEKAGLKNIIDSTPVTIWCGIKFIRGDEIQMWLEDHLSVKNYVIIDDRIDMQKDQLDYFVKVNSYCGFSDEDLEKAMIILNNV